MCFEGAVVFGRSFCWIAPSAAQRNWYLTELTCRESGYLFFTAGDLLLGQSLRWEKMNGSCLIDVKAAETCGRKFLDGLSERSVG
jgi:hypothetical protein